MIGLLHATLIGAQLASATPAATGPVLDPPPAPPVIAAPAPDPAATVSTEPATAAGSASDGSPDGANDGADAGTDVIVVTGHHRSRSDPLEVVNAKSFAAVQAADSAVVAPMARVYERGLPRPVRDGLHNFIGNLQEPVVAVNFLLQHRIGKAAETVARFTVNTVAGIGGLFDLARRKPINLPHRENGFADTMGFYGVKPGPYLFLPLIGSTTVRDLAGYALDHAAMPFAIGGPLAKPAFTIPKGVVSALDSRVKMEDQLDAIHQAENPYLAMRDYYLKSRQDEIDALHTKRDKPPED